RTDALAIGWLVNASWTRTVIPLVIVGDGGWLLVPPPHP
ncbi:MAG: hypothetical protein GDYSWBUE_000651, partial [Candidatus Fervidibacterota bacterium]